MAMALGAARHGLAWEVILKGPHLPFAATIATQLQATQAITINTPRLADSARPA